MFEDCSGRKVRMVEDAECYLWKFMAENLGQDDPHVKEKSRDFDLYLPWLLEILEYQKSTDGGEHLPILQIQQLYMDAAWNLTMQGWLRPGPRTITGDSAKDGCGKGYSLTCKGVAELEAKMAREMQRATLL